MSFGKATWHATILRMLALTLALPALMCWRIACATLADWAESRARQEGWMQQHDKYKLAAQAARDSGTPIELLWYGDSITERLRGTRIGKTTFPYYIDVYNSTWPARFSNELFAIAGDDTPHLMWRLLHGESPRGLQARVAIVLIGTNDLGHRKGNLTAGLAEQTAQRVQHIVMFLLQEGGPQLHVVLQGLLPRGEVPLVGYPKASNLLQPSRFTPFIDMINSQLEAWAATQRKVTYVYCGNFFLVSGTAALDPKLMPDALHPSEKGTALMLEQCLAPVVLPLLAAEGVTQH